MELAILGPLFQARSCLGREKLPYFDSEVKKTKQLRKGTTKTQFQESFDQKPNLMSPGHVWSPEELASEEKFSINKRWKNHPGNGWEEKVNKGSPQTQTMVELNNYPCG